jgi:hypothetical protein
MDVPTRSSRTVANGRARASFAVGVLALAVLPAAVFVTRRVSGVRLLDAGYAVPLAAVLGIAALALGGHARKRVQLTVGRVGEDGVARAGRWLGGLAVYLAVTAALALGFYGLLNAFA